MLAKKVMLLSCVGLGIAALLVGANTQEPQSASSMEEAASAFLESLSPADRETATFEFDDEERVNWHFIPREREGLSMRLLEGESLKAAKALIQSGLSEAGYDQAVNVMSLEELLYLLEEGNREERRARRDPQNYFISIFGKPSAKGRWGWRVEGHHLSLNYTIEDGQIVSSTPEFFGANPGTVDAGVGRRIRVLGPEEDIARQILKLCNDDQTAVAWIEKEAPRDIRGGGEAQPVVSEAVGLAYGKMNADQKKLLQQLIDEYLKNMPADIANKRSAEVEAGMQQIKFAWWGSSEVNEPHYYRVQGPTFIIEYNNVQNNANHVHSIWRDLRGDFGISL